MLNLPRVTGWGSDTIARAIMERSEEKRKKEDEKTKTIANAILQRAQQGDFTEEGFRVIEQSLGPEIASVYKKTAERAKNENELRLENMKREKTLGPLKMVNEYMKGLDTLDKMGNIDKESAAAITQKINATYKALGLEVTINPLMDSKLRKQEYEKSIIKTINAEIKKAETSPTPDNISKANDTIALFGDSIDKTLFPIYKSRLDAITNKLQKQQEQTDKMATEKRAEKTKIEQERRTQKIKMTNPKTGRTVEVPASQQRAFEQAGWELGGKSELPKEGTETPEQRRSADLQIKKDFALWKQGLPDSPEKGLNANQRRILDKSLADAGSTILNNAESEAVKPYIVFVNKYLSKEPYVYVWTTKKGFWGDRGKGVRVDLPAGATAEDIKYTMKIEKKSMDQVLKDLGLIE